MATNDENKLLRKVLSKFIGERTEMSLEYIKEDLIKKQGGAYNISFDELCEALREMESEARADERARIIEVLEKLRLEIAPFMMGTCEMGNQIEGIDKAIQAIKEMKP